MALEFLFSPLLTLQPALAVLVFAIIVLFVINIFYKVLIKQDQAKAIKDRQKEISKRMQAERKAGNLDKVNSLMKESLSENSKLMRMTMKPMIVSFVIVIIFLPGMNTFYGDKIATINNNTGIANLDGINHTFALNNEEIAVAGGTSYNELSSIHYCDGGSCFIIDDRQYEVTRQDNTLTFAPVVATFPFALPLLGYNAGWLAWYILVSIPLVVIIRKVMKIYV